MGELAGRLDVLGVAVGAQPLVPLRGVLRPQRVPVDGGVHDVNNVIGDAVAADPTARSAVSARGGATMRNNGAMTARFHPAVAHLADFALVAPRVVGRLTVG